MKTLFISIVFGLSICTLYGYPITPRPLRKLISESEYCIAGKVVDIKQITKTRYYSRSFWRKPQSYQQDDYYAQIVVTETLQGTIISKDTIYVSFEPNVICPSPAMYFKDTDVLVFLDAILQDTCYTTHALSYGSKIISSNEELQVYKDRIREMQQILTIRDTTLQHLETLEWLIRCAENRYTRWEGVYELSPESDFISQYDDDLSGKYILESAHTSYKERLYKSLIKIDTLCYADFGLMDLVLDYNPEKIKNFLKIHIDKINNHSQLWYAPDLMYRYAVLTKDDQIAFCAEELKDLLFGIHPDPKIARQIWNTFYYQVKTTLNPDNSYVFPLKN
ncbi:hypothetical protein QNI19_15230 [Cytophagaceae bacterium DM2B3-1]|uniref:Uncharacterized protein n=1 Tax=Xanthocytophaga flava TaxID=3048013 RepID=A0ABT7CKL4_9BACT|nr:hypothetical protein [Xanthocytophaga flavus]MDJ1494295.1 hypothetical protein [Xanthocytophaga flavus]